MKKLLLKLETAMEKLSVKWEVACLVISAVALALSLLNSRFNLFALPFDIAWVAIVLCGVPILLEAVIFFHCLIVQILAVYNKKNLIYKIKRTCKNCRLKAC